MGLGTGPDVRLPRKAGLAEALARRPPRARPAPHSPLTLARAAEPGSGNPCGCRMPSGRARRGDPVPGYSRAREAAEDSAGGRGAPPFQQALRRARSPRKVWRSRGGAEGAEGPRPRSAPPCSWRPTVPTGERPPPARHRSGSSGERLRAWHGSPGEWPAWKRRGSPLKGRYRLQAVQNHA